MPIPCPSKTAMLAALSLLSTAFQSEAFVSSQYSKVSRGHFAEFVSNNNNHNNNFISNNNNNIIGFGLHRPTLHESSWRKVRSSSRQTPRSVLHMVADERTDSEIERLRTMAAKLRAEAASLEAEMAQEMADAAERAFRKFDTNRDGTISLDELKEGLERTFKMELPEKRVQQLMADFDKTGDGVLELNEFVGLEKIRTRLDALAREEKANAAEKARAAKVEEEAVQFVQAQLSLLNDGPPSNTDKIWSVLPYLFPLLDGLQFAKFLVLENPDNPLSVVISLLYLFYRSVPFGGLIAFFALSFLSGNPTINRLIRFNMQQAIYLDIALFFPGLVAALYGLVAGAAGFQLPMAVTEVGNDILFLVLIASVSYCAISSLLGITPDKLPLISNAVNSRMPTIDMFDKDGRFKPMMPKKGDDDNDKEKDAKKSDEDKKD